MHTGAFGLALRVAELPANVAASRANNDASLPPPTPEDLVRHFLIEPTSRGVRLKGCSNEPTFGSLAALVYQHSITPLALPCKLVIPTSDVLGGGGGEGGGVVLTPPGTPGSGRVVRGAGGEGVGIASVSPPYSGGEGGGGGGGRGGVASSSPSSMTEDEAASSPQEVTSTAQLLSQG